ncbi:Similar to ADP-ribosylation factor-like protein 3; acc. no. Q02804 [Pyronema omphalodes CBS 100304]|uniref:Similar to ADP-ribosylation factor-like protein 3 acc. no. Q02804 n=1 Tax=Pyronema omphalodes (strain CBS 100304) TaxID=1076935 RepID=U4LT71_PYROM|nr:Similar to ADP-ribosylation factor-like protein 3; acc. no. Q02804 [Pyronema omphalodes CBS 100304]
MYHLAKGLYQYVTSKEEYSVLLLGLDNAGKTTLLEKIKSLYLSTSSPSIGSTIPTVGQNVSLIPLSNPSVYLKLWDIGGQSTLRKLWKSYYSSAHAIVFVIDSTDLPRINSEVVEVLREVIESEETEGVPILVLANKQDRDESLEIAELKEVVMPVVVELGARDSRVLPVSALEGQGVREAVEWLRTRVVWNRESRPPTMR